MFVSPIVSKCCENCPNNPANNPHASGVCMCALPALERVSFKPEQLYTFERLGDPREEKYLITLNEVKTLLNSNTTSEMVVYC